MPVAPTPVNAAMTECQAQAFVEALKPRCSGKPVVAVLALNEVTETTDFLLPHAVLQRAGVVDVEVVAPRRGRVFDHRTKPNVFVAIIGIVVVAVGRQHVVAVVIVPRTGATPARPIPATMPLWRRIGIHGQAHARTTPNSQIFSTKGKTVKG